MPKNSLFLAISCLMTSNMGYIYVKPSLLDVKICEDSKYVPIYPLATTSAEVIL